MYCIYCLCHHIVFFSDRCGSGCICTTFFSFECIKWVWEAVKWFFFTMPCFVSCMYMDVYVQDAAAIMLYNIHIFNHMYIIYIFHVWRVSMCIFFKLFIYMCARKEKKYFECRKNALACVLLLLREKVWEIEVIYLKTSDSEYCWSTF